MPTNQESTCRLGCLLLFVSLLVFLPSSAFSQQSTVINVYTGPRSLSGAVKDSNVAGTSNPTQLFIEAMFREAEMEYTFTIMPWSRAQLLAQSEANVLIYAMVRTEQRENLYEWVGVLYPAEIYLHALKGKLSDPPETLEEARQFKIGLARQSAADNFLRSQEFTNLVYAGDPTRSPVLLERGRVDLWPMTRQEALGIARDYGLEEGALVPLIKLEEISNGTNLAISKKTDPEIVARLRSAYRLLVENGTHARLLGNEDLPH